MNIILCGYHWSGCKALEILSKQNHNIFVFTHKSPYHIPDLERYCIQLKIPFSFENISKVKLPFKPDIICSIYYKYLIKSHVIQSCEGKIFNLHPSLLPKYRGCSSLTWAIINGEKFAGFTYHYINNGCDTGNIILQEKLSIEDWDTQETLYTRVMFESLKYFSIAFNLVANDYKGAVQKGESSYFPRGCPYNGQINSNWDRKLKERFIRAMIYPPYPVAKLKEKEIFEPHQLD